MENQELIKQVTEKAEKWLTPAYDAETQAEVKRMLENPDKTELIDSFYKDLEFGTGGLRGIMGAGTNRMNIYTVGAATQGLSNYLNKCFAGKKDISVVVGHDCRNNSDKFAKISADIFSANGIKVYLFDDLRPTPEVSFAIRHFGCQSGINITASHNPREYNGYKAYWDDGAQVLAPHDTAIIDEVNKVTVADIKFNGNKDLIQIIGKEVDKVYLEMVHSISIDPEVIRRQKDLSIVYTPLHGAGRVLIPDSLKEWGFENINCVPEQMVKDGNFPTVVSPNPENAEALSMAIALAKKIDADIVMASDPDADRVGMACKDDKGEWVLINGNQTCLIFLYYIIKNRIAMGKMQPNDFIVKTIVTTELIKAVADKNKIEMRDCYTGFKWIAREKKDISVVVGHDCRNNSDKFAKISADIFSANGIKVYLFDDLRPTPEVSFAIRHFGCQSGINITASHNPREYNGYKAYWDDGAQVLAPHDTAIIDEVNKVTVADIKFNGNKDLIQIIGKEVDKVYLEMVHSISIDPEVIRRQKDLSIVYTPLHGAGRVLIPDSLKEWGFENINCVPEQMVKDGNFPTVVSPNPENAEALSMAIALAKKIDADIVMASDPDADRVGMACKDDKGEWVLINGNQTCLIFLYYIIKNRIAMGKMQPNDFIVKTIVTTELIKAVADKNKIEMRDCYTGFKWIAREIRLSEGKQQYIGGGEESYGFLAEDFVRDKDAVSACSLLAEICAWAKDQGKTLYDVLMEIYVEYGFSKETTVNVVKPGKSGAEEIKAMMDNFRANPPKEIGGSAVSLIKDYKTLELTDAQGNVSKLDMPETSNVLQYFTVDGTKISVRPSGTEPKIKFYIEVKGEMGCPKCYTSADAEAEKKVEAVRKSLGI